jgi:hypothetical protein
MNRVRFPDTARTRTFARKRETGQTIAQSLRAAILVAVFDDFRRRKSSRRALLDRAAALVVPRDVRLHAEPPPAEGRSPLSPATQNAACAAWSRWPARQPAPPAAAAAPLGVDGPGLLRPLRHQSCVKIALPNPQI